MTSSAASTQSGEPPRPDPAAPVRAVTSGAADVFTALFLFVIASTSRRSMAVGFTGITLGLMLTLIHLITIPVDNTSVTPRAASRPPSSSTAGR